MKTANTQQSSHKRRSLKEVPDVFQGTGKLMGQYKHEVEENAEPVAHPPRQVPIALKEKLKQELEKLKDLGIIT